MVDYDKEQRHDKEKNKKKFSTDIFSRAVFSVVLATVFSVLAVITGVYLPFIIAAVITMFATIALDASNEKKMSTQKSAKYNKGSAVFIDKNKSKNRDKSKSLDKDKESEQFIFVDKQENIDKSTSTEHHKRIDKSTSTNDLNNTTKNNCNRCKTSLMKILEIIADKLSEIIDIKKADGNILYKGKFDETEDMKNLDKKENKSVFLKNKKKKTHMDINRDLLTHELDNAQEKVNKTASFVNERVGDVEKVSSTHNENEGKQQKVSRVYVKDSDEYLNKKTGAKKRCYNEEFYKLPFSERKQIANSFENSAKKHSSRPITLRFEKKDKDINGAKKKINSKTLIISF